MPILRYTLIFDCSVFVGDLYVGVGQVDCLPYSEDDYSILVYR